MPGNNYTPLPVKCNGEQMLEQRTLTLYRCAECGEVFDKEDELLEHEMTHWGQMHLYRCEMCERVFGSAEEFREHERTH